MILQYLGHSFFVITTETGAAIATDPYGKLERYPERRVRADVCTVSHHHFDHDGLECITGKPLVLDQPGVYQPLPGLTITGVPTFHDHHEGTRRGRNLIFIYETEGLRIAHCGDLGHLPTAEQVKALGALDVLLLPVGGTFTVNAEEAMQTARLLRPKVTIPMHYRTGFTDMNIAGPEAFLTLMNVQPVPAPLLRLTAADMSERDGVMQMDILPAEAKFE